MNVIIDKYGLNTTTWTHKGFHGVLNTFFPVEQEAILANSTCGYGVNVALFFSEGHYIHHYWHDSDLTRIRIKFFDALKKDPKHLKKLKKKWKIDLDVFDKIIVKVQKTNLEELTNSKFYSLYKKFYQAYIQEYSHFMALADAISMPADNYLIPEFQNVLGDDLPKVFPLLVTTKYTSFIEQETQARDRLLSKYKKIDKIPKVVLRRHATKFFYIQNNYAKGIYLSVDDFRKMIIEQSKKKVIKKIDDDQNIFVKNKLIKKYQLTSWHKTLLYIMDEFFGIQDTRKKYVLIANYYLFSFLKELSRRTNIDYELLRFSTPLEFEKILHNGINEKILSDRRKFSLCICSKDGYEIITGKKSKDIYKFFNRKKLPTTNELSGMVASKGKAIGRVKIILKIHDMINFDIGDILVSSMTRPEMTLIIKQASAIITDEGGITSHAAIVARELGIPCIIGTKNATKILKDGDLVEVDAEKGLIKKM